MVLFLLHRDIVLTVTPAEAMPMGMMFTWSIAPSSDSAELLSHVQLDGKVSQSGFDATPIAKMEKKDFGARSEKLAEQIFLQNIRQIYGEVGDAKRRCSLHLCSYYKNNLCELFY
ncbi:hypothetical protein T03_5680 [Trichinella britovi]|uniref:Uncharacterized protein n=1 Tax=Trichinella britovi TaxID=45882 RepID=A0A0V1DEQ9_TRIBR|nr:hypothetical protein T03_5680 [Trichinella britovi]